MKDLSQGFIALFRQFVDWEWYDDANTMRLFIHCLLLANYKDKKWRGKLIKRGSFITSQPKLAHSLKLSIMQIRNSLKKLKSTGEITVYTTADYSVITVNNYDKYQNDNRLTNSQKTEKEQAKNRLRTTTNNIYKDTNNIYNISSSSNVEKLIELSEEEEELLKSFSKRKKGRKIGNYALWREKVLKNPNLKNILLEEKEKIKAEKERKLQAENIPPEIEEKSSPEDEKRGLELLRKTAQKIKKGA